MPGSGQNNQQPRKPADRAGDVARDGSLSFTMVKGRHTWRFGCARGEEHLLVKAVVRLARTPGSGLEIADAAAVSQRVVRAMGSELHEFTGGDERQPSTTNQSQLPTDPRERS
jgi:hypothetical protein